MSISRSILLYAGFSYTFLSAILLGAIAIEITRCDSAFFKRPSLKPMFEEGAKSDLRSFTILLTLASYNDVCLTVSRVASDLSFLSCNLGIFISLFLRLN